MYQWELMLAPDPSGHDSKEAESTPLSLKLEPTEIEMK